MDFEKLKTPSILRLLTTFIIDRILPSLNSNIFLTIFIIALPDTVILVSFTLSSKLSSDAS